MRLWLGIASLLFLVSGTLSQDLGFDLADALDNLDPTKKPNDPPKVPKNPGSNGGELDLFDAVGPDEPFPPPDKPTKKPQPPKPSGGDSDLLDLGDALGPDLHPEPTRPPVKPGQGGGGGFDITDLEGVAEGGYKPEGGGSGPGYQDPGHDPHGNDQTQEAGSGQIAGIASAIGVALLGAASSYFAYQKKKLCFKLQGGTDPESGKGHHGTHSEPQVLSNLLRSS